MASPVAQPQAAPAPSGGGSNPAGSLHEHALQAEKHLEQLATGLTSAGADPSAIKAVTQMAEVCRKLVSAFGKGQEATGDKEPPADTRPQPRNTMEAAQQLHQDVQANAAQRGGNY